MVSFVDTIHHQDMIATPKYPPEIGGITLPNQTSHQGYTCSDPYKDCNTCAHVVKWRHLSSMKQSAFGLIFVIWSYGIAKCQSQSSTGLNRSRTVWMINTSPRRFSVIMACWAPSMGSPMTNPGFRLLGSHRTPSKVNSQYHRAPPFF